MTGCSSKSELTSGINVTPMIDVLLVLLIIFMVIVPALPRGESAQVPQPAPRSDDQRSSAVVLEVQKGTDGSVHYAINQQQVAQADLMAKLAGIYANRAVRVLFLKGDDQLSFRQMAEVIDLSHAAGVDRIGLLTPNAQAGR